MFSGNVNIMLYVDDVLKEKEFWKNIGFSITSEEVMMDYPTFDMKPRENSNITFTVFAKEFIKAVSPEVLDNVPSVLLESDNLEELHKLVLKHAEFTSEIQTVPFMNFHFKSPSGIYFAVKGV